MVQTIDEKAAAIFKVLREEIPSADRDDLLHAASLLARMQLPEIGRLRDAALLVGNG